MTSFLLEDCYRRTVRVDGEEVTIDILDTACRVSLSLLFSLRNLSELSQTNVELRDVYWLDYEQSLFSSKIREEERKQVSARA